MSGDVAMRTDEIDAVFEDALLYCHDELARGFIAERERDVVRHFLNRHDSAKQLLQTVQTVHAALAGANARTSAMRCAHWQLPSLDPSTREWRQGRSDTAADDSQARQAATLQCKRKR